MEELRLNVRANVIDFPFVDPIETTDSSRLPNDQPQIRPPTEAARDMCLLLLSSKQRPSWSEITRHPWYRFYETGR